jgi:hypothetical protein
VKVEKDDIKENRLHPVCNDIDFGTQYGLLFEFSRTETIQDIAEPVHSQTYEVVSGVLFDDGQCKKSK